MQFYFLFIIVRTTGSYEQSPRLTDTIHQDHHDADFSLGPGESQLREDLADAMKEAPNVPPPDEG